MFCFWNLLQWTTSFTENIKCGFNLNQISRYPIKHLWITSFFFFVHIKSVSPLSILLVWNKNPVHSICTSTYTTTITDVAANGTFNVWWLSDFRAGSCSVLVSRLISVVGRSIYSIRFYLSRLLTLCKNLRDFFEK